VRIAAASNFAAAAAELERAFEAESGHDVQMSFGSTGKLAAQIERGAPYHVFLAADAERPTRLEQLGLAKRGSRFTYAVGRLALYGPLLEHPEDGRLDLRRAAFSRLAIANPRSAPYGRAALQVLDRLGVRQALNARIVEGQDVAQALHFIESGAAELGFVAMSSLVTLPQSRYWLVPDRYHDPIRQDAVLLLGGVSVPAAHAFVEFLRGDRAKQVITRAGYGRP
jgi:molybdate transport system substrate-binding protein